MEYTQLQLQFRKNRLKQACFTAKRLGRNLRPRANYLLLSPVIMLNILLPVAGGSEQSDLEILANSVELRMAETRLEQESKLPAIEPAEYPKVTRSYQTRVTVYNSVPWQTDGDPFTTASGTRVRFGTVAANCLPFGTKLRIPEMYGDKIFTVEDRLAPRMGCSVIDVWQEYSPDARSFGAPVATVEIIETAGQNLHLAEL